MSEHLLFYIVVTISLVATVVICIGGSTKISSIKTTKQTTQKQAHMPTEYSVNGYLDDSVRAPNNTVYLYDEIYPFYNETDPSKYIYVVDQTTVDETRKKLINFIWKTDTLPSTLPTKIENNIVDPEFSDLTNLRRINKITVSMEYGIESTVYYFVPKKSVDKLIIYHEGHDYNGFYARKDLIQYFLNNGYSIAAFSMPCYAKNFSVPIIDMPDFGKIIIASHVELYLLDSDNLSFLKFFFEPVNETLNYLTSKYKYSGIYMIGLSGGGWTTTVYSAIDPRIKKSYPIAGSYPFYLRAGTSRDLGDIEQFLPSLYRIANYLDLYVLGAYGSERSQMQIINKYDNCCYGGVKYKTYEKIIQDSLSRIGPGIFSVFEDDSLKEHGISISAMDTIRDDLLK